MRALLMKELLKKPHASWQESHPRLVPESGPCICQAHADSDADIHMQISQIARRQACQPMLFPIPDPLQYRVGYMYSRPEYRYAGSVFE